MQIKKFYGSIEVAEGAFLSQPPVDLRFGVVSVCQSATPEEWTGEVRFGSHTLLRTGRFKDPHEAARAAERMLEARVAAVFSADGTGKDEGALE